MPRPLPVDSMILHAKMLRRRGHSGKKHFIEENEDDEELQQSQDETMAENEAEITVMEGPAAKGSGRPVTVKKPSEVTKLDAIMEEEAEEVIEDNQPTYILSDNIKAIIGYSVSAVLAGCLYTLYKLIW